MFDFAEIKRLVELVQSSDIGELEVSRWFSRVKIRKVSADSTVEGGVVSTPAFVAAPTSAPLAPPAPAALPETAGSGSNGAGANADLVAIRSPMVGTFYSSPSPDTPPFKAAGAKVSRGDTVCIVEAMKLMNEIEADVDGTIAEILVQNAEPVQYDQVLFLVDPS
jgi:acetyl-CoA carboxylase biotin carboxyl carrier protein